MKLKKTLNEVLASLGACDEAVKWAKSYTDAQEAWNECRRGDWLLWIAATLGVERKLVVRAACACARTALRYVPEGETRPLRCIETTEAWCEGNATIEQVQRVRTAAPYAAPYAAAADAAADAAAYAAYAAPYAAADAAADAAAADAAAGRRARTRHANIVRGIISYHTIAAALHDKVKVRS